MSHFRLRKGSDLLFLLKFNHSGPRVLGSFLQQVIVDTLGSYRPLPKGVSDDGRESERRRETGRDEKVLFLTD